MVENLVEIRLESGDFSCDGVQVHRLSGREAISQLFSFDLEIVCRDEGGPTAEAMAGATASIVFLRGDKEIRKIHGMIAEVDEQLETEVDTRSYRLRLMPRAFRLTLVETQEIYLDLSVPEIIRQKLDLVGLSGDDVEMRLLGSYPKLELVVQYRETDLAFVSRLAEHLGVSFFFEHGGDRDRIVFTDQKSGFSPMPGGEEATFRPRGDKIDVYHLEAKTRLIPSQYVMQDYNYRTPHVDLTASHESPAGFAGGVVEYGAHYKTPEAGKALATIRAEEREATRYVLTGHSDLAQASAGSTMKIEGHRADLPRLLLVSVEHHAVQPTMVHGGEGERYRNTFRAIDAEQTYRPPRVTPRPRICGVVTAVVEQDPEPPPAKYAVLDEDGRYTVRFFFDTTPTGPRKYSRPIRMLQPHAGTDYGMHMPLKPGIEVQVIFVDGDPDRPMIAGAVPNPETPSPVRQSSSLMNRIKTASGILIEMKDS
ncbi:MAG: type VI secretion system tip protein TssI/VgrG [Byssovorax sp.]